MYKSKVGVWEVLGELMIPVIGEGEKPSELRLNYFGRERENVAGREAQVCRAEGRGNQSARGRGADFKAITKDHVAANPPGNLNDSLMRRYFRKAGHYLKRLAIYALGKILLPLKFLNSIAFLRHSGRNPGGMSIFLPPGLPRASRRRPF